MKGKYLVDTNTAIFFFNGKTNVINHWQSKTPAEVKICAITLFELHVGSTTSSKPDVRLNHINTFLKYIDVLPIGPEEAAIAANLVGIHQKMGRPMGSLDSLIASAAVTHNLVLVTNNTKHFEHVPGLTCVDWTK
ncbi:MAG: type II toxin-antitoxin system VapC family toxin [Planctomycetota bacterium]